MKKEFNINDCTLDQLSKGATNYLKLHWDNGGTSEFDKSINDISRATIIAMKREYGQCYMLNINRYPENKGQRYITKYTGQKIYNFEYTFIMPVYDSELKNMLIKHAKNSGFKEGKLMSNIKILVDRIYKNNGIALAWS